MSLPQRTKWVREGTKSNRLSFSSRSFRLFHHSAMGIAIFSIGKPSPFSIGKPKTQTALRRSPYCVAEGLFYLCKANVFYNLSNTSAPHCLLCVRRYKNFHPFPTLLLREFYPAQISFMKRIRRLCHKLMDAFLREKWIVRTKEIIANSEIPILRNHIIQTNMGNALVLFVIRQKSCDFVVSNVKENMFCVDK